MKENIIRKIRNRPALSVRLEPPSLPMQHNYIGKCVCRVHGFSIRATTQMDIYNNLMVQMQNNIFIIWVNLNSPSFIKFIFVSRSVLLYVFEYEYYICLYTNRHRRLSATVLMLLRPFLFLPNGHKPVARNSCATTASVSEQCLPMPTVRLVLNT